MTPPLARALAKAASVQQLAALPVPTVAVVARVSAVKGTGQVAGRGAAALAVVEARAGIAELADIAALAEVAEVALAGTVAAGSGAAAPAAGKSPPESFTLAPSPLLNTETIKASSKPKFFTRIPLLSHNMTIISKCRRLQTSLLDGGADADSTPP